MALQRPTPSCGRCEGQHLKIRRRTIAGGSIQFRWQCLFCGEAVGSAIAQAPIRERWGEPPEFDEGLAQRRKVEGGLFEAESGS